jgi:hypothetical protein
MALSTRTRVGRNKVSFLETAINLADITAGSVDVNNTVTVPGAQIGDTVTVNWTNEQAAIVIEGYVSAVNTVTIKATNGTSGAINAADATFYIAVHHRD